MPPQAIDHRSSVRVWYSSDHSPTTPLSFGDYYETDRFQKNSSSSKTGNDLIYDSIPILNRRRLFWSVCYLVETGTSEPNSKRRISRNCVFRIYVVVVVVVFWGLRRYFCLKNFRWSVWGCCGWATTSCKPSSLILLLRIRGCILVMDDMIWI